MCAWFLVLLGRSSPKKTKDKHARGIFFRRYKLGYFWAKSLCATLIKNYHSETTIAQENSPRIMTLELSLTK